MFLRKIQPLKLLQCFSELLMHSTLVNLHFGVISGKLRNPGEAEDVDRLIHV